MDATHPVDVTTLTEPQAIFDHVVAHLASMTKRSLKEMPSDLKLDEGDRPCAYRGKDGNKCAVGCLLTDEEVTTPEGMSIDDISGKLEGASVALLAGSNILPDRLRPQPILDLLSALQSTHDSRFNWGPTGPRHRMTQFLLDLAAESELNPHAIYRFMPTGPRKTASQLSITDKEYETLIAVREELATGQMRHMSEADFYEGLVEGVTIFNMGNWFNQTPCGTACCIGGWMEAHGGFKRDYDAGLEESPALFPLFYPHILQRTDMDVDWNELTDKDAVRAIDHFLAGAGAESWPRAIGATIDLSEPDILDN